MNLGLDGRVVLVTGASAGIGRAIAESFLAEGARVTLCSRSDANLSAVVGELPPVPADRVMTIAADLSQPSSAQRVIDAVTARWGRLDVLINNVGGPPPGHSGAVDDAAWQAAVDLTLMSAVRMARASLPLMRAQRWGRIVNVSSYSVKQPIDGMVLSNSVRLAVLGWAKSLANEVAADGVLVNTVCPGWTRTQRVEQIFSNRATRSGGSTGDEESAVVSDIPLARLAEPREIADVVVFLASERASYLTGTALQVDGGIVQTYS